MECSEVDKIAERRAEYLRLKEVPDYKDVEFNAVHGGLKATHVGHNFDRKGGEYERHAQNAGFNAGHAVIFKEEKMSSYGQKFAEVIWDGMIFEVAGRETATANNILRGLKHCASKHITKIAVLDFPNGGFNVDVFREALKKYKGLRKRQDGQFLKFKQVVCVEKERIVFEADMEAFI